MTELDIIDITSSLASQIKFNRIKEQIISRINELKLNTQDFKNRQEVLLLICNIIEHLVSKKDCISKRDLAIQIITELYTLNAFERAAFESNIDFLCSNKMIKKVSKWKLFCSGVSEWLFTKKK